MPRTVRVKYEKGVLKPLRRLELEDGRELDVILVEESLVEFARRMRRHVRARGEPSEELSRERDRLELK